MKCPKCKTENRDTAKVCKKCGHSFEIIEVWRPTWKWHLKTLGIIYVVLIFVLFAANIILKPYLRQIPKDITPWMKELPPEEKQATG